MSQRSNEIDVVRLMALVGICVVNIPVMAQPASAFFLPPDTLVDRLGMFVVAGFFQLKFFVLFSFVFGWGVHIQSRVALSRNQSFRKRYFRRMAGLALLGFTHAVLVFNGDILLPYALLGTLFWVVRDYSVESLLGLAKWMIPLSICFFLLFVLVLEMIGIDDSSSMSNWDTGRGGSFLEMTQARLLNWPVTFAFIIFIQGPLVFGAFAAGLAAGKNQLLSKADGLIDLLRKKLPLLLVVAIPINVLYACTISGFVPKAFEILHLIGFVFIPLGASSLAAVYLYLFLCLARRLHMPGLFLLAGRNSLSTYVMQGVIAGLIFGGYGLGYYNKIGQAMLLPLSLLIAFMSILCIGGFAKFFGRGPLEPLLRHR